MQKRSLVMAIAALGTDGPAVEAMKSEVAKLKAIATAGKAIADEDVQFLMDLAAGYRADLAAQAKEILNMEAARLIALPDAAPTTTTAAA